MLFRVSSNLCFNNDVSYMMPFSSPWTCVTINKSSPWKLGYEVPRTHYILSVKCKHLMSIASRWHLTFQFFYYLLLLSFQFSHSVMPNPRPHGLQQARPPCPSPTPRPYSNSCPLCWWCHPTISPSIAPSMPAFNFSQHQGLFQWVSSSHQVAKVLEFQLQHQSFQWIFRTDFLWDGLGGSPRSPRDSQESSPTLQFKSINSSVLSFLYSPTLTCIHD